MRTYLVKKTALLFILILSHGSHIFASTPKNASSVIYQAELSRYDINHKSLENVESGAVAINQSIKTVQLTLQPEPICPSDMFCILVVPEPVIIKLPLVSQNVNECGAIVYIAEFTKVLEDGVKEVIKVLDHSKSSCSNYSEVEVEYSSNSPWVTEEKSSHFSGETLKLKSSL